jgi:DNA-binding transcriptional MerR regulator
MAEDATARLRPDRTGIEYRGEPIEGFPYLDTMTRDDQVRVARWAKQLAPERMTQEQRRLLAEQPPREISARRREGVRQDEFLRSPPVRGLWRSLDDDTRELVLNPDTVLGKRYPLGTNELARLTGLSRRQVQHWSDRRLLPHWTDERGFRFFEAPAAIVAFALRDRKQHERQFYADIGTHEHPLPAVRDAVNIVGMRTLDLAQDADPQDLADAEDAFRTVADSLHTLLAARSAGRAAGAGARVGTSG